MFENVDQVHGHFIQYAIFKMYVVGTGLSPILAHPFSNIKIPYFALAVQVGVIPKH